MLNLILQELVPVITAFALFINSIGGIFGISAVIPYNPERVDVVVSGEVITDIDEILDYYNAAVKKTGFVLGTTYQEIEDAPKATGPDGAEVDLSAYWQSVEGLNTYIFEVPGDGEITAADVKSAKMSVKDGKRSVVINIKDACRDSDGEDDSVSRAFGYASIQEGFEMVGMNVVGGQFEETYSDGVISCIIDDNSGKIIYGDWDLTGDVSVTDMTVEMFGYQLTMSMEFTSEMHTDI